MTDTTESFDGNIALEKMNYTRFVTSYTVRRPAQAPSKIDLWDTMTLPTGSIIHTMNGMDTLVSPLGGLPDVTNPLIMNEKLPIYLKIHSLVSTENSVPLGVKDNYVFRANILNPQIAHFYQSNRKFHRVMSDRTMASMPGALVWVDYSPLNELRVSGTLHTYRKFDIIFRTILDKVSEIGNGRHHYIVLPQSNELFTRSILQRTFKELSVSTLTGLSHDPSIFPILHLLGYVYGKTKDLKVTPYKEDVKILGKDNEIFDSVHSTSLLERLNPSLLASINFVIHSGNRAVVYNLADLAALSEDVSFYTKFYRHMMNLRLPTATLPEDVNPDSDQFDEYVSDRTEEKEAISGNPTVSTMNEPGVPVVAVSPVDNRTIVVKHPTDNFVPVAPVDNNSFEDRLRKAAVVHSTPAIEIDPKKESRRNILLENHLKVTIGGKALGELIQPLDSQKIAPKVMPFVTSAPEESYQKSSLVSMDKAYYNHAYHHEFAKVVGSLAKHGMFITKVEEDKTHTEMDRTTTHRLHLTDLNGKSHHVKFTIPDVDENGLMKLSGIDYRLTRQIANVPICKISPTRVNLSSYYNKVIIERVQAKRYSYEQDTVKLIMGLRSKGLVKAVLGSAPYPTTKVAYDYTAVGRSFTEISFGGFEFVFGGDHAPYPSDIKESMTNLQKEFGTYVGTGQNDTRLFWGMDNSIQLVDGNTAIRKWKSFHQMLADILGRDGYPERTPIEWTQANIINQTIPIVFILAYKFGLKAILDMIRLDYRFYVNKADIRTEIDDIEIPMADGTLVFNRYPLAKSLVAAGLAWTSLKDYRFADLSIPDTYGPVIRQKGLKVGVLKGLSGFFDFFVDPITETILEKMNEPITFHSLLLRANVMLTDYHAIESSSVGLHRFRLYERLNGFLYNEIFRALANHRGNPSSKKSFSINPEAVFQKIVQDPTMSPNEVINPVHEVKQRSNFTFTGGGGRMARSFTPKDLIYPKDGIGVISDAVPDSSKVGITAFLSASPNIDDIHGIPKPYKDGDTLEPPQILSIGSMVMPGGTTDDGKRNSYLSIQISHYVPNHNDGETLAVRTGYDAVLPHLSGDVFAISAEDNGIVESIDEKQKVVKIRYDDKPVISLRTLKLPYLDGLIDSFRVSNTSVGYLIPETEISEYPLGGVFAITKNTYGKIIDRLRCETVDAIPDANVARKQNTLVNDFVRGKYKALYFIRLTLIGNRTSGVVKSYSYASVYSQNSGAYLLQTRTPHVKVGEKIKTGDILIYNPGFFVPDPMTKQVTFKHGVIATVALVEKSTNHEDACEISRGLSKRLKMTPCHQREVITKKDAVVLDYVKVGDHVETSDSLCVISDDYLVGSSLSVNSENLDIIEKLNRQTPHADYTGVIRKIRILYGCDREDLSDSLKAILKVYEKEVRDEFKALSTTASIKPPEKPGWVAPGTKYIGVDFTKDTVILEFMIEETIDVWEGDKVCFANANKSITAYVSEKEHYTESGIPVDALFSTTSIINRIVKSPFNGIAERNLQALKEKALEIYFEDKK